MNMTIGIVEIGVVVAGVAVVLWLLPKTLPQLGKALHQFQEEIKRK